jgi:hypothetical protein
MFYLGKHLLYKIIVLGINETVFIFPLKFWKVFLIFDLQDQYFYYTIKNLFTANVIIYFVVVYFCVIWAFFL